MLTKLKFLFSISLLMILLYITDIDSLVQIFINMDKMVILILILIQILALFINTYKWQLFIPSESLFSLFKINLITQFYTMILPGQGGGEVAKIYKMRKMLDIEKISSSVILERLLSLFGILIVGLIGLVFSVYNYNSSFLYINVFALFSLCVAFIFIYFDFYQIFYKYTQNLKNMVLVKINSFVLALSNSFKTQLTVNNLTINIFLSVFVQFLYISMVLLLCNSISLNINFIDWCWIFSIISISMALPISIGGLGVREGLFIFFIEKMGGSIEQGMAISMSLLFIQLFFAFVGWYFDFNGVKSE